MRDKKKILLLVSTIIVIGLTVYFVNDYMKYTTFENEFNTVKDEYNHDEEIDMVRIEHRSFDSEMLHAKNLTDQKKIRELSENFSDIELKESNHYNLSNNDHYQIILHHSNSQPSTYISIYENKILISEPFIHGSYEVIDENNLYTYLNNSSFDWDEELEIEE
ncbi:hypothetical protein ACKXGF_00180 [Alkalibacillus sp. S2W]|uniref:hypothetical protein n=1 Tax=Alkalibacillus sp. S2W TaxID=3386553 RepID=UPI00398C90AC